MSDQSIMPVDDIMEIFSLTKIGVLLFSFFCLAITVKFINAVGKQLNTRIPSRRLLIAQVITIISFLFYIIGGGYLFYGVINPPKELLLAVSGTLAVALGLSIKDLISSIVAGVILLFDRPFQVGDRISFSGSYGEITAIGLRAVRLVTLDDSVITIPNSKFITELVSSGNFGELNMMIEINFHVSLNCDLKMAQKILTETAATSRFVYLKKPISLVFNEVEFANSLAMQIRVKCYVIDVKFEKALQTDILVRGNEALIAAGIKRPVFPISNV